MNNAELIQKIKAEIERLKAENESIKCASNSAYCKGYDDAFYDLLSFLSTLEPEKPMQEGLEEEINRFRAIFKNECDPRIIGEIANHFAQWQKEKDTREMIMSDGSYFQKCYELGKKDMKEQMMKDAVETKVVNNLAAYPVIYLDGLRRLGLKYGDKVRIIIVKED